jgi:hypothetical protein
MRKCVSPCVIAIFQGIVSVPATAPLKHRGRAQQTQAASPPSNACIQQMAELGLEIIEQVSEQ